MKIKQLFYVSVIILFANLGAKAQIKFGSNQTPVNANAVLELESTNKGLLLPRIALTATTAFTPLTAHIAGMAVYNTATVGDVSPGYYYNNGTKWVRIADGSTAVATVGAIVTDSISNIYTTDGLLTGNRIVNQGIHSLTFNTDMYDGFTLNNNSTGGQSVGATILSPNNNNNYIKLGKNLTSGNTADIAFRFDSTNSSKNAITLGFHNIGDNLTIQKGGNIGISNGQPKAKLDIALGDSLGVLLRGGDWPGGGDKSQVSFGYTWAGDQYRHDIRTRHQPTNANDNAIDFYVWTPGMNSFKRAEKQVMTLNGEGKVGIGTKYPTTPLETIGTITSTNNDTWDNVNARVASNDKWPVINLSRARGIKWDGTQTLPLVNDKMGVVVFKNQNLGVSAAIESNATENQTATATGGNLLLYTTPNGTTTQQPRVTIENDGKVGIGTTLPKAKLDVTLGDSLGVLLRGGDWPGGGDKSQVSFGYTWAGDQYRHDIRTRHQPANANGNAIDFYVWTPEMNPFKRAEKQVMTLNGEGKVGIGITYPKAKLDVTLGDSLGVLLRGGDWPGGGDKSQVSFGYTWAGDQYRHDIRTRHQPANANGNAIDFYVWTPEMNSFKRAEKQVMTLNGEGKVGIGTKYPTTPLETIGAITSTNNDTWDNVNARVASNDKWPVINLSRARGTKWDGTQTLPLVNDKMGVVVFKNQNLGVSSAIESNATENQTATATGGNLLLYTTPNGTTTQQPRVTIENDGKVGIGTTKPATELHIVGTGGVVLPVGTTAERPVTVLTGMIRFNTTLNKFEGYDGTAWIVLN